MLRNIFGLPMPILAAVLATCAGCPSAERPAPLPLRPGITAPPAAPSPASLPAPPAPAILPARSNTGWTTCRGPGLFVTSLCIAGDTLWAGTEDTGLWRWNLAPGAAGAEAWRPFESGYNLLPEGLYGMAADAQGRLWLGTLNQGVVVYNGKEWKTCDVMEGCGGERVFAIAADADAARGNVWIATDHGLTQYATRGEDSPGAWQTFTRRHGLPSDQVSAVAVAPGGRVWIGTECDGLAWADPPYEKWQAVRAAAERSGDPGKGPPVVEQGAAGLPSNLINDVAVFGDGTVVAATDFGLGISRDGGQTWTAWQGLSKVPHENYACGLAFDSSGALWFGTRHKGLARLDLKAGDLKTFRPAPDAAPSAPDDYVKRVAVAPDGSVWCGTYGGGVARLAGAAPERAPASPAASNELPDLPPLAGPPSAAELEAMREELLKVPNADPSSPMDRQPLVVRLDDDWLTRGDWLGRYGRYWIVLSAICSPQNYVWGGGPEKVAYAAFIGPGFNNDSLRYWVHWLHTNHPDTLEMPPTYLHSRVVKGFNTWDTPRRQAEWCDDGHAYPLAKAGPDLYCALKIPKGLFTLSLYFNNKDGHTAKNRFRDFVLSVRRPPGEKPLTDVDGFDAWPELARGRVVDFWHGEYKRFLVRGPDQLTVRVERNHSHNTTLMAVALDLVDEFPLPYYHDVASWEQVLREQESQVRAAGEQAAALPLRRPRSAQQTAGQVLDALECLRFRHTEWWACNSRPYYAALARWFRSQLSERMPQSEEEHLRCDDLATCYFRLGLYSQWEATLTRTGVRTAREIEKALRWDGKTDSYQGKGYDFIRASLESRPIEGKGPLSKNGPEAEK